MGGGDQKNLLLATFLSIAVILTWQFFFVDPEELGRQQAEQQRIEQAQQEQVATAPTGGSTTAPTLGVSPVQARETALAEAVQASGSGPLRLNADATLSAATLAQVLGRLTALGATRIDIVTEGG